MEDTNSISKIPCVLQKVVVRPIFSEERALWEELMGKYHYLGFHSLIGETLRYVALLDDRWVALIGWGSAALHCQARDQWIGWTSPLKQQRLHLIANNIRFLILPTIRIPNLASKILALNIHRLASDWQHYHDHPILLAETFVDPKRFLGTCYKASGWIYLGQTQGFRKSAKRYIHHGEPKLILVKPMDKQARHWLTTPILPKSMEGKMTPIQFNQAQLDALMAVLRTLPDARHPKGVRHSLRSIIAISLCAILSGAKSFIAIGEWAQQCNQNQLKRFGTFYDRNNKKFVAPSETSIRRTLQNCYATQIDEKLSAWVYSVTGHGKSAIGVDGKTLKGAKDAQGNQVQLLSAFLHQ